MEKRKHTLHEKNNSILASTKDQKIFFDEIVNPQKPNDALKNASKNYANKCEK